MTNPGYLFYAGYANTPHVDTTKREFSSSGRYISGQIHLEEVRCGTVILLTLTYGSIGDGKDSELHTSQPTTSCHIRTRYTVQRCAQSFTFFSAPRAIHCQYSASIHHQLEAGTSLRHLTYSVKGRDTIPHVLYTLKQAELGRAQGTARSRKQNS